ncbi:MAG TPA: polymer-forming cytoskeletal protein [Longimicrobiales bacterium]|nr:polymer-forming cytoskeletal protein [Longimicrobiales bacterium]
MRPIILAGVLLALASTLSAQEQEIRAARLPASVERQLLRFFQDPATVRMTGPAVIEEGRTVTGNVGVYGGGLRLHGRIEGDLVVVGGNLVFGPAGAVTGDVTVVNGELVEMPPDGAVGGEIVVFGPIESATIRASEPRDVWDRDRFRPGPFGYWPGDGRAAIAVRATGAYNRIEGLPVGIGPVIETSGRNPLRLEALAIWRTETGFRVDEDRLGYLARLEQFLGGEREWRVGASLRSTVDPIEDAGLTELENTLSSALFRRDYRDYVERTGWTAYVRATPRAFPLDARVEYRDFDYDVAVVTDPWSLFNGDDAWRLQPLTGVGRLRTIAAIAEYDRRNDPEDPTAGWLASARFERGLGGSLRMPDYTLETGPAAALPGAPLETDFTTAVLDLRTYRRVGRSALLNLRATGGGALGNAPLPPQFQYALGGPGSLPAFRAMTVDCGARAGRARLDPDGPLFLTGYGCDRFALFQVEYIGSLDIDFDFGFDDRRDRRLGRSTAARRGADKDPWDWDWDWDLDVEPRWAVFFDAGRGWAADGSGTVRSTAFHYDAGVGLLFDDFGIYASVPLSGERRGVNFNARLVRRF